MVAAVGLDTSPTCIQGHAPQLAQLLLPALTPSTQSHYHPPPRHTLQLRHTPPPPSLACPTLQSQSRRKVLTFAFQLWGALVHILSPPQDRSNPFLVESAALPSPRIPQC